MQGTVYRWVFRFLSVEELPDAIVNKNPFNFLEIIKANLCILVPVICGLLFLFKIETVFKSYKLPYHVIYFLRNHVNKVSKGYKIHLVINKNSV